MKAISQWQNMQIVRPLLTISREALLEYATTHQLQWIEDPSNQNTQINRNFLRHQIWPLLQRRWPAINRNLARSANNLQESQILLDELAQDDLNSVEANSNDGSLNIIKLLMLSEPRQRNVLRFFIKQLNIVLPSRTNLQRILTEVCHAAVDGQPQVSWSQYIARRYQNTLYISRLTQQPLTVSSVNLLYDQQPILLDADHQLIWKPTMGEGIRAELFRSGLALTFRQGGEKFS